MKQEIKWRELLVNDCRQLIVNNMKLSTEILLFSKWKMGDRIIKDLDKFGKRRYGDYTQRMLAKDLGISQSHVSAIISFRETVGEDFQTWVQENINEQSKLPSWKKIMHGWLKGYKEEKVKVEPEDILKQIIDKFSKERVKLLLDRTEEGFKAYSLVAKIIPLNKFGANMKKLKELNNLLSYYYSDKFEKKVKEAQP